MSMSSRSSRFRSISARRVVAGAGEQQEPGERADPGAGEQAAQVLETFELRDVHRGQRALGFTDRGDPVRGEGSALGDAATTSSPRHQPVSCNTEEVHPPRPV